MNIRVIILIILMLLTGGCFKPNTFHRRHIKKDIIFKTHPGENPYSLPLRSYSMLAGDFKLTDKSALPQPSYRSGGFDPLFSPAVDYFWALNSGEFVFIDRAGSDIYILDPRSKKYRMFKPRVGGYTRLEFIWVGPEDEIYVLLAPGFIDLREFIQGERPGLKLFRFINENGKYVYDDISDFPKYEARPSRIRISASDHLFISDADNYFAGKTSKYTKYGVELYSTRANGETADDHDFLIDFNYGISFTVMKIRDLVSDAVIMVEEIPHFNSSNNFKSTFDNELIFYNHYNSRSSSNYSLEPTLKRSEIFGRNFTTGYQYLIDLEDLERDKYKYYGVSDVSINYLGEIYVMVVYFNEPGTVTGDELIVMYRYKAID